VLVPARAAGEQQVHLERGVRPVGDHPGTGAPREEKPAGHRYARSGPAGRRRLGPERDLIECDEDLLGQRGRLDLQRQFVVVLKRGPGPVGAADQAAAAVDDDGLGMEQVDGGIEPDINAVLAQPAVGDLVFAGLGIFEDDPDADTALMGGDQLLDQEADRIAGEAPWRAARTARKESGPVRTRSAARPVAGPARTRTRAASRLITRRVMRVTGEHT